MKIICVIPAWNEAKHIVQVVEKVKNKVDQVIVVDDHSTDDTYRLAQEAGALALRHPINRGQGAALQTGTDQALKMGADIIVHFDADDQFSAEEIKDITAPIINNEADIVFGSRFLEKKSALPYSKKYIILPLGRLINHLLGAHTSDPQSGFRAYTKEVANSFRIENNGMAHCSEILIKLSHSHWRIKEVPITVTYHEYGQKFSGGFRILKDLFISQIGK
ncbi:MAG: glycosyltransferase family 2 protein [Patescibacteria group bacterium]|nr:glycosyltransferase family 2 protein [Patescibacteria group bacterium]